jgi:hypothetical protein
VEVKIMHANTSMPEYRLSEHELQYKQACLSEYKWNAAVCGALWFAVSTVFTGWYAFRAGYPVSGATAIFSGGVNVALAVAVAAALAGFFTQ